jgi:ribonuclease VapC
VYPLTPVDDDLAIRAALLEPLTLSKGLGIGDRLCLALAARTTAVALTANAWLAEVAEAVGVEVQLIQ